MAKGTGKHYQRQRIRDGMNGHRSHHNQRPDGSRSVSERGDGKSQPSAKQKGYKVILIGVKFSDYLVRVARVIANSSLPYDLTEAYGIVKSVYKGDEKELGVFEKISDAGTFKKELEEAGAQVRLDYD